MFSSYQTNVRMIVHVKDKKKFIENYQNDALEIRHCFGKSQDGFERISLELLDTALFAKIENDKNIVYSSKAGNVHMCTSLPKLG